jgi:nucleotide-binding universal stress UspA family protein
MAYKDLLVHVDDTRSCAARVQAAVDLAAAHEAHLTGVYIIARRRCAVSLPPLLIWLDELVGQHGEPGVDLLAQLLEFSLDFVEPGGDADAPPLGSFGLTGCAGVHGHHPAVLRNECYTLTLGGTT